MSGKVGAGERLSVTMLFSIIAHAVVVLGLTFEYAKPAPSLPSLDVILVQSATGKKPEKADFLANANNEGGGTSDKAVRPTDLVSAPVPKAQPGIAPMPLETGTREPQPANEREVLTQKNSHFSVQTKTQTTEQPERPQPNPQAETDRKLEMARLANELHNDTQVYAKRPKKKYISANTKEAADAAYQAGWVARIERIGNLNYPDAARRRHLHGNVVLRVTIAADGQVRDASVYTSSGYRVLDDAAMRIVHLAAPFPPIPREKDAQGHRITELVITRTWQFLPGNRLQTRGTDSQ